jgi:hypothetical protein
LNNFIGGNMDLSQILAFIIGVVGNIPALGPVLVIIVKVAAIGSGLATAFVALWHSIVGFMQALAVQFPSLGSAANSMSHAGDGAESFLGKYVLPILNQLSVIPVPVVKPPAPPVA